MYLLSEMTTVMSDGRASGTDDCMLNQLLIKSCEDWLAEAER